MLMSQQTAAAALALCLIMEDNLLVFKRGNLLYLVYECKHNKF